MTTNTFNLLNEVRKNLRVKEENWERYLSNPQSINKKFFTEQMNLSLDMFTLTKIYCALAANFVCVLK